MVLAYCSENIPFGYIMSPGNPVLSTLYQVLQTFCLNPQNIKSYVQWIDALPSCHTPFPPHIYPLQIWQPLLYAQSVTNPPPVSPPAPPGISDAGLQIFSCNDRNLITFVQIFEWRYPRVWVPFVMQMSHYPRSYCNCQILILILILHDTFVRVCPLLIILTETEVSRNWQIVIPQPGF